MLKLLSLALIQNTYELIKFISGLKQHTQVEDCGVVITSIAFL